MKRALLPTIFLVIAGVTASWAGDAPGIQVSGKVSFSQDGAPAAGVRVIFFDLADLRHSFSATTDATGSYALSLAPSPDAGPAIPRTFRLLPNYPNPFNPSTAIPYELQDAAQVRLEVFNMLGQRVRTLVDEFQAAGSHTTTWGARDDQGAGMATGIYLYRLTVEGVADSRQMVLVDGPASTTGGYGGSPLPQAPSASSPQPARTYGLTISSQGIVTYVHPEILVDAGTGPLSFAVERVEVGASPKVSAARILGDVNNDGKVNISDALIVATYGLDRSITIPNSGDISLGDVNKDSRINISDALIIATYGIDPTNSSLPQGIGQPLGPAPLTGSFEITSISPGSGKPGESVTLRGRFSAPGSYWVAFDTLEVPALSQSDSVVTTLVPLRSEGTVQVVVWDTLGHKSTGKSFIVKALPAPQHTASQTTTLIQTAGERVAQSVPALMQGTGLCSANAVQEVQDEFTRWNRVLPVVASQIRALPSDQARQVISVLENSGALEVMEELGSIDVGAPKVAVGAFDAHHLLARADGLSFVLGNVNALLKVGGVALLVSGAGVPAAHAVFTISFWMANVQDLINGVIPSDLETFRISSIGDTEQGKSTFVQFRGDFKSESTLTASGVKVLVRAAFERYTFGIGSAPIIDQLVDKVLTTLAQAGINELERSLSADLEQFKIPAQDIPLDFALYSLDVPALMELLGLPGATTVRMLTTRFNLDLNLLNAVTITPATRAEFTVSSSQLTGRAAGSGTLTAQAFTFKRWDGFLNLLGFVAPQSVGPVSASFQVMAPANQRPVAAITAPANNSSFNQGSSITFQGTGTDPEDGRLSGSSLVWTSSRDGRRGTGANLPTSSLSVGTHTITLTATDSRGEPGTATITVTIDAVIRRPDLLVDNLSVRPPLLTAASPCTVLARVANQGQGAASRPWVVLRVDGVGRDSLAPDIATQEEAWMEFEAGVLSAGAHTLEVVADPNGRVDDSNRANNRTTQSVSVSAARAAAQSLVFILDLSGSMNNTLAGGQTRLQLAKTALTQVLSSAPTDGTREYALVAFGENSCSVRVAVPFTSHSQEVTAAVAGLSSGGNTPLAQALRAAQHLALDSASSDQVQLVLLSDGRQSGCGSENPVEVARLIASATRAKPVVGAAKIAARVIKLTAIGLGVVPGSEDDQQIRAIADAAGTPYHRVEQPQDLVTALGVASGLQTPSAFLQGTVRDLSGRVLVGAGVRLLNHPNFSEQTDANGTYRFPADFQGVDSLIVETTGYLRYATEVYVSNRAYDVQMTPSAALLPTAVAKADPTSVEVGGQVTLRGGESTNPTGDRLIYHWSQLPSNPFSVSFPANDSESAFAVRAILSDQGTYRFVLVVENEEGLRSVPDTVEVRVTIPFNGVASLPGGATMEFVWIPPGTFTMGSPDSDPNHNSNEGPQHQVTISKGFWLGKYEITQAQWQALGEWRYDWSNQREVQANPNNPEVLFTWERVQEVIHRLNEAAGDSLYRLPTEAEWEYACRAGTTTRWSFGDDESQLDNYGWVSIEATLGYYAHAVGAKEPNPWGLHDVHGNVWEYCQDWYGYYSVGAQIDPRGPATGTSRVVRGGAYNGWPSRSRSASRDYTSPNSVSTFYGARLMRIR